MSVDQSSQVSLSPRDAQAAERHSDSTSAQRHTPRLEDAGGSPVAVTAKAYDIVMVLFVAFLLISNIAATKLIAIDAYFTELIFDGGAILFPLTYVLGDVLAEVYGFKRASRAIFLGFAVSILASLTFLLVVLAPPGPGYADQSSFEAVLGFVPRIVAASLVGYLVGQFLNAWVLVRIREVWGKKHLWARLIGSTVVGEAADTALFCTIAFAGIVTGAELLNYIVVGYIYKVAVEIIMLPVTYRVIAAVRHYESTPSKSEVI